MTDDSSAKHPAEQPILWLGMSGFTQQQRAVLEASLRRSDSLPRWRTCVFGDADAWWVNGAKVKLTPDGNLRVAPGLPTEHALKLNLSEVDRPIAFAMPLAGDEFEPRCKFDPVSEPSIHAVLLQFETWLWLTRAEFVLGAQIVHRDAELRRGVYQVSNGDRLLAVLDFQQGKAAILPRVHPVDLWGAQWVRRPIGAHDLPETFVRATPAQLAWAYVRRTDRDMLPPRYRVDTIYYRRVPGVPMRWLRDSQLMLLRELRRAGHHRRSPPAHRHADRADRARPDLPLLRRRRHHHVHQGGGACGGAPGQPAAHIGAWNGFTAAQ